MGPYSLLTPQPLMLGGGAGFSLFGPEHLAWLAVCALVIAAVSRAYARLPRRFERGSARRRVITVLAFVPLCLLVSDDAIMIAGGAFYPAWWPLHLCNFCEYLGCIYALHPRGKLGDAVGDMLFTFSIIGGICALLFCNWTYCPPLSWPSICGFLEHTCMIALVVSLLAGHDLVPRMRTFPYSVAFGLAYVAFARVVNAALDTNFGFVNEPAAGSPLVALADIFGPVGYVVVFVLAFVAYGLAIHVAAERKNSTNEKIEYRYELG